MSFRISSSWDSRCAKSPPSFLNQAGQPLTSTSCASSQLLSLGTQKCAQQTQQKLTTLQSYEMTRRTIREITSPNRSSTQIIHSLPTGESLIAVSIQGHGKQATATLLVVINGPVVTQSTRTIQLQQVISTLWNYWQPAGFYFIFLSTALGTSADMLISHNLTRRLRRIAQATKEWSRGEFQMTVHDHARDEVGNIEVVGEAGSGEEAIQLVRELAPSEDIRPCPAIKCRGSLGAALCTLYRVDQLRLQLKYILKNGCRYSYGEKKKRRRKSLQETL